MLSRCFTRTSIQEAYIVQIEGLGLVEGKRKARGFTYLLYLL